MFAENSEKQNYQEIDTVTNLSNNLFYECARELQPFEITVLMYLQKGCCVTSRTLKDAFMTGEENYGLCKNKKYGL